MNIIMENLATINQRNFSTYTCLLEKNSITYGLDGKTNQIYRFYKEEEARYPTKHCYSKLSAIVPHDEYLALSHPRSSSSAVYRLNSNFYEFDVFWIENEPCETINDLWFDNISGLVYVCTKKCIQRYNLNGDFLGTWMTAQKNVSYQALCTFKEFLFVAYEKQSSLSIAMYNKEGALLENLQLGTSYEARNLQIIHADGAPLLQLFAYKNYSYPYFIDCAFLDTFPPTQSIEVDAIATSDQFCTSYHIDDKGL